MGARPGAAAGAGPALAAPRHPPILARIMPAPRTLAELEQDVARDLALTAHPRAPWLAPKTRGGAPVLDCLVVGAGQCGLAVAFALRRDRVDNLLVIDAAPHGKEGPWVTHARMRALRSPKDQTGPDLRIPSLTY
jgi:NADPH-dependent 2,4-dienoyl-CoA reductase/sulfur reductase-like enzyme